MPIDPEQEMLEAEVRDAQAQIEARNTEAGGQGAAAGTEGATAGGAAEGAEGAGAEAAKGAAQQGQEVAAGTEQQEPSLIEKATNGKFKSQEEFDQFLAKTDELAKGPKIGEEEQRVLDLYTKYGPDAYRYLGMAKTDVNAMKPKDVFMQHFAVQNPNLSMEEVADGWETELKKELGNPALFIDFDDEETYGQGAYLKGKLQGLIGDRRKGLSDFYSNLVPTLLKHGQDSEGAQSNQMPVISEEDKAAFAREAGAFTGYRPDYLEALGEDGADLEIAVKEIPGFAEVAKQIIDNPQAFLEAEFMKDKDGGAKGLNITALLNYAASKAGNPLILQKYGHKVGEGRYADGLADGTGKNADELREKLGFKAKGEGKSQDDGLTDEQRKRAEIQAKADEVTRKMSGMA